MLLNKSSSLSWQKKKNHTQLAALPQYTSGQLVRSVSQKKKKKKKAVHKEHQPAPAADMLFYASSSLLKFTYVVDFFSRETRSAHYNFCLQKWTYFLVLDTQGIILRALIQEVNFLSCYTWIKCQTVLFDPEIGLYHVLLLWARVDLVAMAMNGSSPFPEALALLVSRHQTVWCHVQDTRCGGDLTTHQRCSQCILQSLPNGLKKIGINPQKSISY